MINRNRQILALMLNVLIFALEIIGMILSFIEYGDGSFEYYTQDSNYLATIASAVFIPFAIMALCGKKPMPRWVVSLRHMATACLALTFFVVLFVLIPMDGLSSLPWMLFSGPNLYHHFLCPLLAMLSFIAFETEPALSKRCVLTGMTPTLLYAIVIIILNIAKLLVGPYPFLHIYEQPWYMSIVWIAVILGMATLLAWLLWLLNRAVGKRRGKA